MNDLNLVLIALLIFVFLYSFATCSSERFKKEIEGLIEELESSFDKIEEITDEDLEKLKDQIILVAHRTEKELKSDDREGYSFPSNYWPSRYYTYPYKSEVAWPPGLYSRLYNFQPGFSTSGYTYAMRPGLQYVRMPRARWMRNSKQGGYFYINNVY